MHYNEEQRIIVKFNVASTDTPTKLTNNATSLAKISKIEIDGAVLDPIAETYTFDTVGEHIVKYTLVDPSEIGLYLFRGCDSITEVRIPKNIENVGASAFNGCTNLAKINIPNSITSFGTGVFTNCTSLPVVDNVRYADTYVVGVVDNTLTSYTIKDGTIWIGYRAFYNCTNLTEITIPNTVTSIENVAFTNCSNLTTVNIPNSVTSIATNAFQNCTSLPVENNIRYADTYLIETVDKTQTTYTIKEGTRFINGNAFKDCKSLTSIVIPNSVISIGDHIFYSCTALESIIVDQGNAVYDSRDNCNAIIETSTNTLVCGCIGTVIPNTVTAIGDYAFYYSGIANIIIPSTVTTIGYSAFFESNLLENIEIQNGVTTIGDNAFYGTNITSITIPNSLTNIGKDSFSHCSKLKTMIVDNGNAVYDSRDNCNAIIETNTNTLVCGCGGTVIPNTVTTIGENAFYICTSLTSITIPSSVTTIGNGAFSTCTKLSKINSEVSGECVIPNNVTSIGNEAFRQASFTKVVIPNSITTINENLFVNNTGLTSVILGNSITTIGGYAFYYCKSLNSITSLATTAPTIQSNTFQGVKTNGILYVPQSSTGYDVWMQNANYYLGKYNWTKTEQ